MGIFMQSLSFRKPKNRAWKPLKEELTRLLSMYEMDAAQLEREQDAYGLCDPYGDTFGPETELLAAAISKATGDYAVTAQCVDSDFAVVELYHAGKKIDAGSICEPYEELGFFGKLHPALWLPLLQDPREEKALANALLEDAVFAEDQLKELTRLTGLPIFDLDAMLEMDEDF